MKNLNPVQRLLVKIIGHLIFWAVLPFFTVYTLFDIARNTLRCRWHRLLVGFGLREPTVLIDTGEGLNIKPLEQRKNI